jgi:hypothetical protein
MENRHRLLLGLGVEIFQSSTAEKTGCLALLDRAKRRLRFTPTTLGADKGFFHENFLEALFARASTRLSRRRPAAAPRPTRGSACGSAGAATSGPNGVGS